MIRPPLIVGELWDLYFFKSTIHVRSYLEPWYADEDYVAFDSTGQRLELRKKETPQRRFGGLVRRTELDLEIVPASPGVCDPEGLRTLLREYLTRIGEADLDDAASVESLLGRCVERSGWT